MPKLATPIYLSLILLTAPLTSFAQSSTSDPQAPTTFDRPVSLKLLVPNILTDQKNIWTFPARIARHRNWSPTAVILGTAAAFVAFDPTEASYFHKSQTYNGFNNVFSSNATAIGTFAVPASLYAIGLVRKDTKMSHTALLAGEAVANAEILTTVLKDLTKRARPASIPIKGGNYSDSWYDSPGSIFNGRGGFPSGHTIAAFSVATVIATRYRNHRWVPFVAYGLAATVGFSRLSLSAHYGSDVFLAAALGYSISQFTVLRQ
jgi:membrane-associated phospholipid phosphatase